MDFAISDRDTAQVVSLSGNFLANTGDNELIDLVGEQIENGAKKFVIDLKDVKVMNSTGLGLLIRILTKARTAGGEAVLTNIPDNISQLLVITKLNNVFRSFNSIDEALQAINN